MSSQNSQISPSPFPNKSQSGAAGANPRPGTKRARTDEQTRSVWDPWTQTPRTWSPFLVVSPVDKDQKVSSLSVFKIQKALRSLHVGDPKAVDRLATGGLLIQVADERKSCSEDIYGDRNDC